MNQIVIGPGHRTPGKETMLVNRLKRIRHSALKSYSTGLKVAIVLIIIALPLLVAGARWAATNFALSGTTKPVTQLQPPQDTATASPGALSTGPSGSSQTQPATGETPPQVAVFHNAMFLGDSITAGWDNDGAHAYPILTINGLYKHNTGNAWYQLVKGRSGAIAAGALLDLKAFDVQPKNVNLMVVELGTNDMVHMSAATFRANYQSLIDYLLAGSPSAKLVCLGPWRSPTDNFGYGPTPTYEAVIKNVCSTSTNSSAQYLDLSALYGNKAFHNTVGDTFHPNDAAAQAIADEIVTALYPN